MKSIHILQFLKALIFATNTISELKFNQTEGTWASRNKLDSHNNDMTQHAINFQK